MPQNGTSEGVAKWNIRATLTVSCRGTMETAFRVHFSFNFGFSSFRKFCNTDFSNGHDFCAISFQWQFRVYIRFGFLTELISNEKEVVSCHETNV